MIDRDGFQGGGEFEGGSSHRTPELGFGRRAPAGGVNQCANLKSGIFGGPVHQRLQWNQYCASQ